MQKSYWKNGVYIDVTTGKWYAPKQRCEICGATYPLSVHHYLKQQRCLRDLNAKRVTSGVWTKEFIFANQKLFTLCYQCHADVERLSNERFEQKHNKKREDYIYV